MIVVFSPGFVIWNPVEITIYGEIAVIVVPDSIINFKSGSRLEHDYSYSSSTLYMIYS